MRAALALARRALGNCWPNPAVGCILVKNGVVVGRGWTQPGGRPHAEVVAVERAGASAKGATAYVTLEPCDHHGKTPPCTGALLNAGVKRVVASLVDPDPRVSGAGFETLRKAGVHVTENVMADEAARLNAGYLMRIASGRPLFTLKTATTLDGRIGSGDGVSQWITGPLARRRAHQLRDGYDAIMVGMGTVSADDPELTCRLPGLPARPTVRIVLDTAGRLRPDCRLMRTVNQAPLWVITAKEDALAPAVRDAATVIPVPAGKDGFLDLKEVAVALGGKGLSRVLVEAGGTLARSLLAADMIDRIAWFRAPSLMGGDGLPAVDAMGLAGPTSAPRFERYAVEWLDEDVLERYDRRRDAK